MITLQDDADRGDVERAAPGIEHRSGLHASRRLTRSPQPSDWASALETPQAAPLRVTARIVSDQSWDQDGSKSS